MTSVPARAPQKERPELNGTPYENDEDCTAVHPTVAEILGLKEYIDEGPE